MVVNGKTNKSDNNNNRNDNFAADEEHDDDANNSSFVTVSYLDSPPTQTKSCMCVQKSS